MTTTSVTVRPLMPDEVPGAEKLLDGCFGAGFGEIDETDLAFAAHADGRLLGVVTAALRRPVDLEPYYAGRVSWPEDSLTQDEVMLIRQIGVERSARGKGVGDALMTALGRAVAEQLEGRVRYSVANAWVHALTGHCPAAPLLERQGFEAAELVPDFFAAMPSADCPGCGEAPCRCSVRVYFRGSAR